MNHSLTSTSPYAFLHGVTSTSSSLTYLLHGVKALLVFTKKKKKSTSRSCLHCPLALTLADVLLCSIQRTHAVLSFHFSTKPTQQGRLFISANKKRRETFRHENDPHAKHCTKKSVLGLYLTTTTTMDMDIDTPSTATTRTKPTSSATTTTPTVLTRLCDTQSESFYIYLTV